MFVACVCLYVFLSACLYDYWRVCTCDSLVLGEGLAQADYCSTRSSQQVAGCVLVSHVAHSREERWG